MPRQLYFMRHGQTLFNKQHKIQGYSDSPLTAAGIEQAHDAGEQYRKLGISFDHFYCSTSERAEDTLLGVMDGMGIEQAPYQRLKALKEFSRGVFEGEPLYLIPHLTDRTDDYFTLFAGEADSDARDRVLSCMLEIMEQPGHDQVLIVSHGGVGHLIFDAIAHPDDPLAGRMSNCSCNVYTYVEATPSTPAHFVFERRIALPEAATSSESRG